MASLKDAGSDFFSWTIFHDISPAIKDLYDRKQDALFAEVAERSYIETRSLESPIPEGALQLSELSDDPLENKPSAINPPGSYREPWACWSSVCVRNPWALREFASVSLLPVLCLSVIKRRYRDLNTGSIRSCK
jgi:hypothetical protein